MLIKRRLDWHSLQLHTTPDLSSYTQRQENIIGGFKDKIEKLFVPKKRTTFHQRNKSQMAMHRSPDNAEKIDYVSMLLDKQSPPPSQVLSGTSSRLDDYALLLPAMGVNQSINQ